MLSPENGGLVTMTSKRGGCAVRRQKSTGAWRTEEKPRAASRAAAALRVFEYRVGGRSGSVQHKVAALWGCVQMERPVRCRTHPVQKKGSHTRSAEGDVPRAAASHDNAGATCAKASGGVSAWSPGSVLPKTGGGDSGAREAGAG